MWPVRSTWRAGRVRRHAVRRPDDRRISRGQVRLRQRPAVHHLQTSTDASTTVPDADRVVLLIDGPRGRLVCALCPLRAAIRPESVGDLGRDQVARADRRVLQAGFAPVTVESLTELRSGIDQPSALGVRDRHVASPLKASCSGTSAGRLLQLHTSTAYARTHSAAAALSQCGDSADLPTLQLRSRHARRRIMRAP